MASRPQAVVFDVLETLLNLEPLAARLEEVGQPASMLQPWFMRFQRDAMALTLAGDEAPFAAVAREALRIESQLTVNDEDVDYVLAGFAELPAHEDAAPALRALSGAGVTTACLTVGHPDNTRRFLDGAGLADFIDHIVTAQDAGVWKPHPGIYQYTAGQLGIPLTRMALVAVHAWDCHGARRAGALSGWCARLEREHGEVFMPADVTGENLVEVADKLLALR